MRGVHGLIGQRLTGRIGVGCVGVDDADAQAPVRGQPLLLPLELHVVGARRPDRRRREQRVEAQHPLLPQCVGGVAPRLLVEVLTDVAHHLGQPLGRQQRSLGIDSADLGVAHDVGHLDRVDVVDAERQHVLVPDRVHDRVRVQLVAEGLRGGAQLDVPAGAGVGREDRCAREPEEVVVAEGLGDGRVHVPELAAVALVEDEDDVPGVDGVLAVVPHEVGELLDRGDDDARIRVVDLPAQLVGGLVRRDRPLGEAVVLLDGLVVQVLAVDNEDDLVDPLHPGGQLRGLEGGEGLARAGGVPDVAATGHGAGLLVD